MLFVGVSVSVLEVVVSVFLEGEPCNFLFTVLALLIAKESAPETAKALIILVERGFNLLNVRRLSLVAISKVVF